MKHSRAQQYTGEPTDTPKETQDDNRELNDIMRRPNTVDSNDTV